MTGNLLPTLGRVRLADLICSEGLASDSYIFAASTLSQSLLQYSAVIVQLPKTDGALLRSGIDSARLYFHQRTSPYPSEMIHNNNSRDWCRTSGYYSDPQAWQETYDYRPGLTSIDPDNILEFPPSGLPDLFTLLGKTARDILDAITFSLKLRSYAFAEILDNIPLRTEEISSSYLSVCCHMRPSFQGAQQHNLATQEDGHLLMFPESEYEFDKSFLTIIKSDRAGLHVRDFHGQWVLFDGELGPEEVIVYPGLSLYQATAGTISPALYRTESGSFQGHMSGRCSLAFKLMPKPLAILSCSEVTAAGRVVEPQFQLPIQVDDFMQRSYSMDHLFTRNSFQNYTFPTTQDEPIKTLLKRKKNNTGCRPLPPSKRLRLEAQRVLKERVQDIADKKGIKLKFCNLKECEGHLHAPESPCSSIRMEIGWPPGVPFVHPHDLPNKAKIGFLEAYEPGWSASQDIENQSP